MFAALGMDLEADTFDLSFREPPLSERSGQPLLLGMGDPVAGPLLGLFFDAPSTPEQLAGPPDLAPAHSHSCDNFRICMKGELIVGKERYHHGEFRLQQSGRPYGQDGDAPHVEGNWRIIFFADRRGHLVRPTNPEIRGAVPRRGIGHQRALRRPAPRIARRRRRRRGGHGHQPHHAVEQARAHRRLVPRRARVGRLGRVEGGRVAARAFPISGPSCCC